MCCVAVCVCVRGSCSPRYLTRTLINIEMTSGREVRAHTSSKRQDGEGEVGRERDDRKKKNGEAGGDEGGHKR